MTNQQSFTVLLSHSNRPVDFSQCSLGSLTQRYADPDRLNNLPALESLLPVDEQRHFPSGLSILQLDLGSDGVTLSPRSTFDPPKRKVQHACIVDSQLVACLEDAVLVFDVENPSDLPDTIDTARAIRIDDPWFAGLHTVFRSRAGHCIVSASAPDAVLEIDLAARCVVNRVRLPETVYGQNYDLSPSTDLRQHYIANDLQLAHLNCAQPDRYGNIVISTLIQGHIARLEKTGGYRILSDGNVGCHAARTTADGQAVYFADSCNGTLVMLNPDGSERSRFTIDSRWLQDVQHVSGNLFLFCVADRNALELIDIVTGDILLSRRFDERGAAVQFVNLHPLGTSPA